MQSVTILGATGSIGQSTLDIIAAHPDQFRVEALTAGSNIKKLYQHCLQFKPRFVAVLDPDLADQLQQRLREVGSATQVFAGIDAIVQLAADTASDIVVSAIVGSAGLMPTLAAVNVGKKILLANKEALVMGGAYFMDRVRDSGATILPIDSEHNAIFQCLPPDFLPGHSSLPDVHSIILTASGGPFRSFPVEALEAVTPVQAMSHPNWQMGPKISVDSATMMNKGLEVIEAHWLFGLPVTAIRVVVHPQSVIHSCVEYHDGSLLAQMGTPDMRIPISYALAWPNRVTSGAKRLNLTEIGRLEFEAPDVKRFPCLRLAYQALNTGGTATAILNAANEVAVEAFCHNQLAFTQISALVNDVLQKMEIKKVVDLETLLDADQNARLLATSIIKTNTLYSPDYW